jgi:hypothetical protein
LADTPREGQREGGEANAVKIKKTVKKFVTAVASLEARWVTSRAA